MKKIIVKKFGGTSLSSFEARKKAVDLIKSSVESDFKVVAVVSAMGRKGDIFSTDTLIDNLKKELPNASDTEKALLTSTGEFYSCLSVASMLRDNKLKVEIFSGADVPIITENKTFNGFIVAVKAGRAVNIYSMIVLIVLLVLGIELELVYKNNLLTWNIKMLVLTGLIFPAAFIDYKEHIIPNKIINCST